MACFSTSPLIQKGVTQGCLLDCSNEHLDGAREYIQDCRAVASYRGKPVSEQHLLLILSQDCDINNPSDHFIEVLPIKKLPPKKVANQQQHNRNYRKLQLPINGEFWLLESELISIIPKDSLENDDILITNTLDERTKDIMIDWRVGRYNRNPFPDKFNQDFLINYLKNDEYELGRYLENHHDNIIDLFIYVTPQDEEQAEKYIASITALINEECSVELEGKIRETLREHCKTLDQLPNSLIMSQITPAYAPEDIRISQELVLRPSDFTLLDATFLRRITLDYLCYS